MAPQLILLRFPNLPRAECKGMDPLLFDLALHPAGHPDALAACDRCPERRKCREFAVRTGVSGMLWAGKARHGKPHRADPDMAAEVCARIEAGGSLQSIAAELGLSHRQVLAFDNARRRRSS